MRKTIVIIGVIMVLALIIGFSTIAPYNKLVKLDQEVKAAWAQVDNVTQRRYILIKDFAKTVKAEANFEKNTLVEVTNARAKATQVSIDPTNMTEANMAKFKAAQGELSSAVSKLLVSVEAYPQLKSIQGFTALQDELAGSENRISTEIRTFNEKTAQYNYKVLSFPSNLMAKMFGFKEKPLFKADGDVNKRPELDI